MAIANFKEVINRLVAAEQFRTIVNNPRLQLGTPGRNFVFSQYLPERLQRDLAFRDTPIQMRTVGAVDNERYGAIGMRGSLRVSSQVFELGNSDVGQMLPAKVYDDMLEVFRDLPLNQAMVQVAQQLLGYQDVLIARGLAVKREYQRAQAIEKGRLEILGENNFRYDVTYKDPPGARVTLGATEPGSPYNNAVDPMEFILDKIQERSNDNGLAPSAIITTRKVMNAFRKNAIVKQYGTSIVSDTTGSVTTGPIASMQSVVNAFSANNLPMPMEYDLRFPTMTGAVRMISEDVLIILYETGLDQETTLDLDPVVDPTFGYDTLGFYAIGRTAGNLLPGISTSVKMVDDDKPSIEFKGWQTTLPIIQIPEAINVFTYSPI